MDANDPDPRKWKLFEFDEVSGSVAFNWPVIEKFEAAFELGVRAHQACDMAHILAETRRQIVDGLINGPNEVSDAIMRGSGVLSTGRNH